MPGKMCSIDSSHRSPKSLFVASYVVRYGGRMAVHPRSKSDAPQEGEFGGRHKTGLCVNHKLACFRPHQECGISKKQEHVWRLCDDPCVNQMLTSTIHPTGPVNNQASARAKPDVLQTLGTPHTYITQGVRRQNSKMDPPTLQHPQNIGQHRRMLASLLVLFTTKIPQPPCMPEAHEHDMVWRPSSCDKPPSSCSVLRRARRLSGCTSQMLAAIISEAVPGQAQVLPGTRM